MSKIKNILLDLGNVVIPISPEKTLYEFVQLGFKGRYEDVYKMPIFKKYEKGEISTDIFLQSLQNVLPRHQQIEDIANAWNAMILDFDATNFLFLNELKKQFKLLLVSNTNTLHADCFEPKVVQATQQPIHTFFHHIYYSQIVGMRKPDAPIFHHIIDKENILPQETLFVDDTLENIQTANTLGFQTIHFTKPTTELKKIIQQYIKG